MKKLTIGFVSMAQPYNTDKELAGEMYKLAKNKMSELENVEVVSHEGLIISMEDAKAAVELFKANPIDLLVVQNGTFSSGQVFMHLVQNFSGFIVLWALPEPPYNGPLKFNSLSGVNLNASLLSNMERQYKYFYASPDNSEFWLDFGRWLKVFSFAKKLKETRIGLFGSRTPGFYTFGLNELSVRKSIGPEIYHVDLDELFREAGKVTQAEVNEFFEGINRLVCNCQEITQEKSLKFARTYVAFKKIIERYQLDAVAVKCWPEFITDYGLAVCSTMAKLVDDGIMAGCEGDILGTVTSLAQYELSGKVPFIADLVDVDFTANSGTMWHCGCAPFKLAHPGCPVKLGQEFGIGGLTAEFAMQPGKVTAARLSSNQGKYRLLVTTGEAIDTLQTPNGTAAVVRFDCNAKKLLDTIIYGGYEHHLGMVSADIKEDLIALGQLLNLETVIL